jgi:hypothetical protein
LQFDTLYGKKAAALYTQAGDYQKTARFYYKKAEDTYYQVCLILVLLFVHWVISWDKSLYVLLIAIFFHDARPTTGRRTTTGAVPATSGTTSIPATDKRFADRGRFAAGSCNAACRRGVDASRLALVWCDCAGLREQTEIFHDGHQRSSSAGDIIHVICLTAGIKEYIGLARDVQTIGRSTLLAITNVIKSFDILCVCPMVNTL